MDYIKQLNAFEQWLETNYLPGTSQLIWYKLFMLFNRCGWSEWVTVDNLRLMSLTDIKSETTFINNKDKLIQSGLIECQKGWKGSPNRYRMTRLYDVGNTPDFGVNNICTPKNEAQTESKRSENDSQNGAETLVINKLNETKRKEIKEKECDADASAPLPKPVRKFVKPTVAEVEVYCRERKNTVSAECFWDFYESKGWRVGNNPMKDWKAAVRTWEGRDGSAKSRASPPQTMCEILEEWGRS